jgi:hypothetical protein
VIVTEPVAARMYEGVTCTDKVAPVAPTIELLEVRVAASVVGWKKLIYAFWHTDLITPFEPTKAN